MSLRNVHESLEEVEDAGAEDDDEYQSREPEYQSPDHEYQSQSSDPEESPASACSSQGATRARSSPRTNQEQGAWGRNDVDVHLTEETFRKFCCGFACDLCRCDPLNYFNLPPDY
jgi:hypothetical protein